MLKNEDEQANTFRLKGYVREINYGRDWKANLAFIDSENCTLAKFDRVKSQNRENVNDRPIIYHFKLVLEEYGPEVLPRNSPTLPVYLCGSHATRLLGMEPEEYARTALNRALVRNKLDSTKDKLAVLSIVRSRDPGKNYGYQIVNTYFV